MGNLILERVMSSLREAAIPTGAAFPGHNSTAITEPVAAVHLKTVERSGSVQTVTVEVCILSPGKLGSAVCEAVGLRAVEVLYEAGAVCKQSGCEYNGMTKTYDVRILASFTNVTAVPVFAVTVGTTAVPYAVSFCAEESRENAPLYAMGEVAPSGVSLGRISWQIELVEKVPAGVSEAALTDGAVTVSIVRNGRTETYTSCVWTSVKRVFTKEGMTVTRCGTATAREVT